MLLSCLLKNHINLTGKGACLALFLFVATFFISGSGLAAESVKWKVVSVYQSPVPMQQESVVNWLYEKRITENKITTILVRDDSRRLQCQIELRYNKKGFLVWANYCQMIHGNEICREKNYDPEEPVLLNQTLIPGDHLNLRLESMADGDWTKDCKVREKVGNGIFVDYLTLKKELVTLDDAVASGMISQKNMRFAQDKDLYLLSLVRRGGVNGELVLQQLWVKDIKFWLYEKKDGRHSWYLGDAGDS